MTLQLRDEQILLLKGQVAQKDLQAASLKLAQDQNNHLVKELSKQQDYLKSLEDRMYKANVTSLDLLRKLKDAETEIDSLKSFIQELKQVNMVYMPVKDDEVDVKLAEFINNYPDRSKLRIVFLREHKGQYIFGSKTIQI